MYFLEIFLLAVSLAMDALAVTIAMGAVWGLNFTGRRIALTALFFGGFQAIMPLIGWFGSQFCEKIISQYGAFVSCGLLCFVGGKMIKEALKSKEEEERKIPKFSIRELTVLAFATSIDALLVGVSFACLKYQSIWLEIAAIGLVTAVITVIGGRIGRCCGNIFGNKCEIAGGAVLVLIGLKTLIFQ